jgi:hypothetical protein
MKNGSDPSPSSGAADATGPYERLGVSPDATFDVVQAAKAARLEEAGDDVMARSIIEAAYDAVLMDRLKERQQGRVSSSARRASQQENLAAQPSRPALPSLPPLPMPRLGKPAMAAPSLSLASGRELWFPLAADGLLLVFLLLVPSAPAELLLALVTGVTVLNLQRRNGNFLAAVGWSFALLTVGLVVGGLMVAGIDPSIWRELPIGQLQVQSLPAWLLLLLGALLIG